MDTEIYSYDSDKIRPINKIRFTIWGNEEIKNISSFGRDSEGVMIPDLYENSEPRKGGLIDTRMGPSDINIRCATCGLDNTYCVGHFAHIDLADGVFHYGFLQQYVKKILSCICLKCSKILVYKNEEEIEELLKNKTGKSRMTEVRNLVKNVSHCRNCAVPVSKIKIEIKATGAILCYSDTSLSDVNEEGGNIEKRKNRQQLTPDLVYDIFKNISDNDCKIIGIDPKYSRPEMMINTVFPVPPVAIRPSTRADFLASSNLEDDATHKLADIIKANNLIIRYRESTNENTSKYGHSHILQYHTATYFENDSATLPKSEQKSRPTKSMSSRMKGKEGRIRGNLMGKRVDFSGRTVITSDPTIDINQLGVPIKIAMNLTFPEVVTPQNIDRLSKLVRNGNDVYPGANSVVPISDMKPGQRVLPINLKFRKEKVELRYGDIVERHLIDGDIVLLNRQPTLHKQSMMGHYIKIINDPNLNTFRLSVAATPPYNADFDGDEMNIFVPQSIQTQIELEEIADVKRQFISPSTSRTTVGIVQDGLLGAYNLTSPTTKIDWKSSMNIMSYTSVIDFDKFEKDKQYTGHELFSMIIPDKINVSKYDSDGKPLLVIKNGTLENGYLTKDALGAGKKNNLTQLIWDNYNDNEAKNFIDNTQRLVNNFNLYNGFSVGIKDSTISKQIDDEINIIYATKDDKTNHMLTEIENFPDMMDAQLFETAVFSEYNVIKDDVSQLVSKNLDPTNSFGIMAWSGSKGTAINTGQMCGCVGMQAVSGKMIPKQINKRTLPYYFQNDDRSESRGLIKNSFMKGTTFPEFFYIHWAGREGCIDSSVKTAESGYLQRRLIKLLEDAVIAYDGTVRISSNAVVQFVYGDTGADTTKQYEYNIGIIEMGDKEIEKKFKFTKEELKNINFSETENNEYYNDILQMRDLIRSTQLKSRLSYITISSTFMLPVNFVRILNNVKNNKSNSNQSISGTKLEPKYIINEISKLLQNNITQLIPTVAKDRNNSNSMKYIDDQTAKTSLKIALHDCFAPKKLIVDYALNKEQFDHVIADIVHSFNKNIVEAGEMVGLIVAQAMGEPLSQLSQLANTWIHISGKINYSGHVKEFVDKLLEDNKSKVIDLGNNSVVLDLEDDYNIIGVSNDEKVSWKRISQISRHMANGNLVRVTTKTGRTTTATLSHSFLKRTSNGIEPVLGSDLKVGHRIPISRLIPEVANPLTTIKLGERDIVLNKDFGWFCGEYIADGWVSFNTIYISKKSMTVEDNMKIISALFDTEYRVRNYNGEFGPGKNQSFANKDLALFLKNTFGTGAENKHIGSMVFNSNKDFISGLLSGYFDGDGNAHAKSQHIRSGSISEQLTSDICVLLNFFGIYASKKKEKANPKRPELNPKEHVLHTVLLQPKYAQKFKDEIGFRTPHKAAELDGIINHNNRPNKKCLNIKNDLIPCVSEDLIYLGKTLEMPGQSRNFGRYKHKTAVGRDTIMKYIKMFEEQLEKRREKMNVDTIENVTKRITTLKSACASDVIWDEIVSLEILDDPKEYVYDFTVPGNDSFMVDCGVLVHNTLNSIHHTGIAAIGAVTQGVPRIKELLSLTKNLKTPQMVIFAVKEFMGDRDMVNKIASNIEYTTLENIRKNVTVYFDPNPKKKGGSIELDNITNVYHTHNIGKNSCQPDIKNLPLLIRIEIDREKMFEKEITLLDIKSKFCNAWEMRFVEANAMRKEKKSVLDKITQCAILSNTDNDVQPVIHIRFEMSEYSITAINDFIDYVVDKFKLKGIQSIKKISTIAEERVLVFDGENHDVDKKNQYVIYTSGVNMYDIRYINGIDIYKTICNDVMEIYEIFGIEAGRAALAREITLAYERAGNAVNYHHISLLVDFVTNNGNMISIDRHGMDKLDTDPLTRASFEKMVDKLITAAVFSEVDHMKGISSRIMGGLVIKGGTGMCDILLDTEMLENSEFTKDIGQLYEKTYNEISSDLIINDILDNESDGDVFMPF